MPRIKGHKIKADDLQKAMEFAGLSIEEGDAILVRTGYSRFFETTGGRGWTLNIFNLECLW